MNPFALRERRQILCSRRWFRALKNFSWRYSLAATVLLLSPFDLLASLGMDMYLPAVPFMPNALGTTASTIQLTLTTYLVMIGAGQLLFGPLSDRLGRRPFYWEVASPTLWRQWASLLRHRLKSFWGFGFFRLVVPRRALFPHLQQYVTFTQVARKVMSFTAYSDPCWPWSRR